MFLELLGISILVAICGLWVVYSKILTQLTQLRADVDKFNEKFDTIKSTTSRDGRFETLKRAFTQPGAGNDRVRPQ